jgi:hypothetical protein
VEKKRKHQVSFSIILRKRRQLLLFILPFLFFFKGRAQEFGGNPPSLKWKQFNTDTARIIFPAGLEKQAIEVSAIVHSLAATTQQTLGDNLKKVNIVLQTQTTLSNGYVSLGPFRSEFYLTPRQNSFELGSLPWHKTLALHEYRHVQQYNNFRKGLSRAFYYVFGEEGQALANNLAVPDWFFEGDAVYQETKMSDQGRGRLPYFFNGYRSIWSSSKNYSWMKLRNGSYRDYLPDHYPLGYLLVSYGYEKFGEEGWKKITEDAARFKGLIYPFQHSFKSHTGQSFTSFRNEALSNYKRSTIENIAADGPSTYGKNHAHFVADEKFPQWADHSHIIYLKSSYKKIPAFYIRDITSGAEKKIRNKAISTDDYFSYANNLVVYSSYRPDPRWGWKNFELITVLDIHSGEERTITSKTRYLSPGISNDGKKIVAVNSETNGKNELHILDATSGKVLTVMPGPDSLLYTYPQFINDDSIVSAVRNSNGEMALGKFNVHNGNAEWLTPFSTRVIGFPKVYNDTILFTMSDGSQDKLFAVAGSRIFLFQPAIENKFTGNYQFSGIGGKFAWSMFTSVGYQLVQGNGKFIDYTDSLKAATSIYKLNLLNKGFNMVTAQYPVKGEIEKYSSNFRLINFHSWRPYINDPEYSYSLISENVLNTLQSELYFTYNRNEKFKETGASISYGALFPVISAGASYTFDRSFADSARRITWNEFKGRVGVSVPLNFTKGAYSQSLNISGSFNTSQVYYTGISKAQFADKRFNYGDFYISASNQQAKAKQNIYPRFAQVILARYRSIISKYSANQLFLNGSLYLPGFSRNHSIVFQAAYQGRDTLQQYNFSNGFPFSRGYPNIDYPRMWKVGGNYHFPIAYPDWGFGNIVYFLRLRGNVFYDYSKIKSLKNSRQFDFKTAGTELYFDTKWWNQLPLSFGIRYSRLLDADLLGISANQWELVLPVNLLSR